MTLFLLFGWLSPEDCSRGCSQLVPGAGAGGDGLRASPRGLSLWSSLHCLQAWWSRARTGTSWLARGSCITLSILLFRVLHYCPPSTASSHKPTQIEGAGKQTVPLTWGSDKTGDMIVAICGNTVCLYRFSTGQSRLQIVNQENKIRSTDICLYPH